VADAQACGRICGWARRRPAPRRARARRSGPPDTRSTASARPGRGPPVHRVELVEALGTSAVATAELWRFLLDLDLVDDVVAASLPVDHRCRGWSRPPGRRDARRRHPLAAPRRRPGGPRGGAYAADDELVIAVEDDRRPRTAGRLLLRVQDGAADVRRTDRAPDLALRRATSRRRTSVACRSRSCSRPLACGRDDRRGATGRCAVRWPRAPWTPEVF
jgi:hypothetical protein